MTFSRHADAPTIIRLLKNADVSTVLHELNHLFVNDLGEMVKEGKGGDAAASDWAALSAFTDGDIASDDPEAQIREYEKIAKAAERYFMTAQAPRRELYRPFANFRKWLAAIYGDARDQLAEPSPEVRMVFDRFLATDEQMADAGFFPAVSRWRDFSRRCMPGDRRVRIDLHLDAAG